MASGVQLPGDGSPGGGYGYTPPPAPPINGGTPTTPTIVTASLPNGNYKEAYDQTLAVSGGTAPYTFAVTAGLLPAGLALSAAGEISGSPTQVGTSAFYVTVTDANNETGSSAFTIVVPSAPVIANASLPAGAVGVPYMASLTGSGGQAPYGFQVASGNLPEGLALAATGGITGIPQVPGSFQFVVQIYDSGQPQGTGESTFSITIAAASFPYPITTMDEVVIVAGTDGALYSVVEGQYYDQNYQGQEVGFFQQWTGVAAPSAKQGELQLGGATISAKGSGTLNHSAITRDGQRIPISTDKRQMQLNPNEETVQDFMVKAAPHSERFAPSFDNGGVAGSWFELHASILWVRQFFTGRKA